MEQLQKTINIGEALADYISEMDYGSIVHYQDIERITKERRGTVRYSNAVTKAKKLLERNGKMIKYFSGGDYKVLYPGDYSNEYAREVRIAGNHIKHGKKILAGAPVNDMTSEERSIFRNVSDFHTRLEASFCGQFVEVKKLVSKKHPLSVK